MHFPDVFKQLIFFSFFSSVVVCLFVGRIMHITYNDGGIISMNLILCSFRTKAASKRHNLKYLLKIFRAVFITCAWLGIGNCVFHLTQKKSHTKIAEKNGHPGSKKCCTRHMECLSNERRFAIHFTNDTHNRKSLKYFSWGYAAHLRSWTPSILPFIFIIRSSLFTVHVRSLLSR